MTLTPLRTVGLLTVACLSIPASAQAHWPAGYKPRVRTWFSYGARYSTPQQVSGSVTVMRATESDVMIVVGWFAQAEPGLGGGKVSVGFGGLTPSERPWVPPMFGAGVKASLLRTWGSPQGIAPGETLIGPELDLTFPYAKFSIGYLWRTGGAGGGLITWGLGVGF